jgi:hypothetical protein
MVNRQETAMLPWISVVVVLVAAFLTWNLIRRFRADRITALNERRRAASRFVSRGELVDGNRHLAVALALTESTFFYENPEMEASIDLEWVREIEYDNELATGGMVAAGEVLRLRSDSQTFEFVVPNDTAARWHSVLPARRRAVAAAGI